jgi:CRISP-associated protein Cas1
MGRSYYIFSSGRIRRKENTLFLENEQGKKAIPVEDVDDFYCFGELDLNTKFINFLSQHEIAVHFFNYYGFYTGSFYPRSKNESGFITLKQAEYYLDNEKRITLAREMINGASHNILKIISYYNKRDRNLEEYIDHIKEYRKKIPESASVNALLGLEGNVRKTYYKAFDSITTFPEKMGKRVKHPPDNIINCLISFGNSLLYSCCLSEIYRTQMNPTISYFHTAGEKRYSLSLDLADIFKPVITDKIIFSVLNKGILKKSDFDKKLNYCYLKEAGRKKFIKEFDDKIKSTIKHRKLNREVSHKRLLRLECYKLIKHLSGDETYKAFKAWW